MAVMKYRVSVETGNAVHGADMPNRKAAQLRVVAIVRELRERGEIVTAIRVEPINA